jgi:hypothetical protein
MKILIAAPVRQDEETFKLYLESLNKLEIPENVTVGRFFIFHNSKNLIPFVDCSYGILETKDEYPRDVKTHIWTDKNVNNIVRMKNTIATYALKYGYDYIFMVDTDLILHPKTLISLLNAQKDIVAEIFWTKWTPDGNSLPNCWMFDSYDGVTDENLEIWTKPGIYKVGMTGACILIHRKVFEAGVNYNDVYNISYSGEDRFFGIRAACAGFELWVDTNYPCIHLYRLSELEKYKKELSGGEMIG